MISVLDESIAAWKPRKTKMGALPHLSYIFRKPKPLGIELKCIANGDTKCVLGIRIQRGKEAMKGLRYQKDLGATTACLLL